MISSKYFKIIVGVFVAIAIIISSCIVLSYKGDSVDTTVSQEYETKIFDKTKITSVSIDMDKDQWDDMIKNALKEEYYSCDITVNGEKFTNVGIRPKGNTSLNQVSSSSSPTRYSFKIEFNHYVDGQTCFGLDKLVLNNVISDTTYMKEYLSYNMMEYIGVTTPLYSYADISVNGEKWGLYLALEGMEESFAQRVYGKDHGMLYKPETMNMGQGMGQGNPPNGGMGRPNTGENTEADKKAGKTNTKDESMNMTSSPNLEDVSKGGEANESTPQVGESNGESPTEGVAPKEVPSNGDMPEGGIPSGNMPEGMPEGNMPTGKGGGPNLGSSGGSDLVYTDDNLSSYSTIFDSSVFNSTNSDHKRVITALKNLNNGENIETYVNVEETLRYFAANTMLVNLDSYVSNLKHNYYLYEDSGQISILPWDFNLAFGGFQSGSSTSAVNFPIDTPVTGVNLTDRPLIGKLLEVSEYEDMYHSYLQTITDEYISSGVFENTVNQVDTLIKDYVKSDPTAFYTYEEYEKSLSVLKEFMNLRSESVKGQLEGSVPSTTDKQKEDSSKLVEASSIDIKALGSQGGGREFNKNSETDKTSTANKILEGSETSTTNNTSETNKSSEVNKAFEDDKSNTEKVGNQETSRPSPSTNNTKLNVEIIVYAAAIIIAIVFVFKFKRRKYK